MNVNKMPAEINLKQVEALALKLLKLAVFS
jgi:hypothetical protein